MADLSNAQVSMVVLTFKEYEALKVISDAVTQELDRAGVTKHISTFQDTRDLTVLERVGCLVNERDRWRLAHEELKCQLLKIAQRYV